MSTGGGAGGALAMAAAITASISADVGGMREIFEPVWSVGALGASCTVSYCGASEMEAPSAGLSRTTTFSELPTGAVGRDELALLCSESSVSKDAMLLRRVRPVAHTGLSWARCSATRWVNSLAVSLAETIDALQGAPGNYVLGPRLQRRKDGVDADGVVMRVGDGATMTTAGPMGGARQCRRGAMSKYAESPTRWCRMNQTAQGE